MLEVSLDGPSSEVALAWAKFYLDDAGYEPHSLAGGMTLKQTVFSTEFGEVMEAVVQKFSPDNPLPNGTGDRPFYRGYLTIKGFRPAPDFAAVDDDTILQELIFQEDVLYAALIALANPSFREPFKTAYVDWLPRFRESAPAYASELGM